MIVHLITSPQHNAPLASFSANDVLILIGDGIWADVSDKSPSVLLYVHQQDAQDRGISPLPHASKPLDDNQWAALVAESDQCLNWSVS